MVHDCIKKYGYINGTVDNIFFLLVYLPTTIFSNECELFLKSKKKGKKLVIYLRTSERVDKINIFFFNQATNSVWCFKMKKYGELSLFGFSLAGLNIKLERCL